MEQSAEPYLLNECYVKHTFSLRSVLNDNCYIFNSGLLNTMKCHDTYSGPVSHTAGRGPAARRAGVCRPVCVCRRVRSER